MFIIKIFKVLVNCHESNQVVSEEKDLGTFLNCELFRKNVYEQE